MKVEKKELKKELIKKIYAVSSFMSCAFVFPVCIYIIAISLAHDNKQQFIPILLFGFIVLISFSISIITLNSLFFDYLEIKREEDLGDNNYVYLDVIINTIPMCISFSIISQLCGGVLITICYFNVPNPMVLVLLLIAGIICGIIYDVSALLLRKEVKELYLEKGTYFLYWGEIFSEIDKIIEEEVSATLKRSKKNPDEFYKYIDQVKVNEEIEKIFFIVFLTKEERKNLYTDTIINIVKIAGAKVFNISLEKKIVHTYPKEFVGSFSIGGKIFIGKTSEWEKDMVVTINAMEKEEENE